MDTLLLLSVLGYLLTVFQLLPVSRRRNIYPIISWFHWIVLAVIVFGLLISMIIKGYYLQLPASSIFLVLGVPLRRYFVFDIFNLLLVIVFCVFATLLLWKSGISKMHYFSSVLSRKIGSGEYGDVLDDLDTFSSLFEESSDTDWIQLLQEICTNKKIVCYISENDASLAINVWKSNVGDDYKKNFAENFLNFQILDKGSQLRYELRHNRNFESFTYRIPADNYLISYLLLGGTKAEEFEVYRPIGNAVLQHLWDERTSGNSVGNQAINAYGTPDQRNDILFESPVYAGAHFFDIMIRESIKNNYSGHMWIFYLRSFVKEIVEDYEVSSSANGEFVNRYEHELSKILSICRDCSLSPIHFNVDYTVNLTNQEGRASGGNLVESAMITWVDSLVYMVKGGVRTKFLDERIASLYSTYVKLSQSNSSTANDYASELLNHISRVISRNDPGHVPLAFGRVVRDQNLFRERAGLDPNGDIISDLESHIF